MSRRRKHLTLGLRDDQLDALGEGQAVARVVGGRGGNIMEVRGSAIAFATALRSAWACSAFQVELACGRRTLCMMPARFNKKLWVRRGGYVVMEESEAAAEDQQTKVTGTILQVLYDDQIKQLKKAGSWPAEFDVVASGKGGDTVGLADDGLGAEDDIGPGCVPRAQGTEEATSEVLSALAGTALGEERQGGAAGVGSTGRLPEAEDGAGQGLAEEGTGEGAGARAGAGVSGCFGLAATAGAAAGSLGRQRGEERQGEAGCDDDGEEEEEEEEDPDLPPLFQNNNRRVIYHEVSDSEGDDES